MGKIKTLLLILIFCIASANVFSADKNWITNYKKEDANYKYFVGRGFSDKNQITAMNGAIQNAYSQAMRLFGTEVRYSTEIYEDESSSFGTTRIVESTKGSVQFKGFEQIDEYTETTRKGWNSYVLYRYSKAEFAKEQARLEALANAPVVDNFSIYGDMSDAQLGILEIVTDPADALVSVDGRIYGRTPLRIVGKLPVGKRTLEIKDDFSEPIIETVIITPNNTVRVERTLKKSKKTINIDSKPTGAKLTVNDQYLGETPIKDIEIEAGRAVKIKLEHPEAYIMEQNRIILPDDDPNIIINLETKPSYISFKNAPNGYDVYVNDNMVGTTPIQRQQVNAGTNYIYLRAKDKNSAFSETIMVAGGETKELPKELFSNDKDRYNSQYKKNNYDMEKNWFISFGYGVISSKINQDSSTKNSIQHDEENDKNISGGLDIGFEYRFNNGILFGFEYNYDAASSFDLAYTITGTQKDYIRWQYKQDTIYCIGGNVYGTCRTTGPGGGYSAVSNVTTTTRISQPYIDNHQTYMLNFGYTIKKLISLYARGGLAVAKLNYDEFQGFADINKTIYGPAFGGGARLNFTKNFSIDFAYAYSTFKTDGYDQGIS